MTFCQFFAKNNRASFKITLDISLLSHKVVAEIMSFVA